MTRCDIIAAEYDTRDGSPAGDTRGPMSDSGNTMSFLGNYWLGGVLYSMQIRSNRTLGENNVNR